MKTPLIGIKAINSSGIVQSLRSRKIKRIYHFIQRAKNSTCSYELCVTYQPSVTNKGTYSNVECLIHALRAFMEK